MIFFVFKLKTAKPKKSCFRIKDDETHPPRKKKKVVFEFEEWPTQEKLLFFPIEDNRSPENCFRIEKGLNPRKFVLELKMTKPQEFVPE